MVFGFLKGEFIDVISWTDDTRDTMVWRFERRDNAIKYGKQNGLIEASIYQIDGKKILVEISDDGAGIADEHLGRIFERFYRTDIARSRKAGGSGLGLAICKHIIEAHGQAIHVRSKPDVGSTFGFTLASKKDPS